MKGEKNKMTLRVLSTLFLVFLLTSFASSEEVSNIVAKVNGAILTEIDLEDALNGIIPREVFHRRMTPEKRATFIPKAMNVIIERELLYQEAKRRGMKVDKKRIKEAKDSIISRFGGKKQFKEALKRAGITEKDYDLGLEKRFLASELRNLEIDSKVSVTKEDIEAYYERNKAGFVRPEARRIRHILIKVEPGASEEEKKTKKELAENILKRAKEGEDFAALAWEFSEDPYRMKSGDLGLIHRGRLFEDLDSVAFSLPVGAISNVIETIYGYHIIKVEEAKDPEQLSLDDVYQKIEKELREKKYKEREEEFIGSLKRNAKIEILKKYE